MRGTMRGVTRSVLAGLLAAAAALPAAAQIGVSTSRDSEIKLGREVAREVEKEFPASKNEAYQERVRRIGTALVESMPEKAYPYEFKVLAVSDFNAFCLPGGFMYVFEGLLTKLPDDNAVAFVMAHEITHAAHRHWRNQVQKGKNTLALAILAGTLTGSGDVASIVHTLISASYSRAQEGDADVTGMEMIWAAGFDPEGAMAATRVMMDLEKGDSTPRYLRSHPKAKDRLGHLQKRIETLKARPRPVLPEGANAALEDITTVLGRPPDVQPAENPWFPLAVGNTWTYAVKSGEASSEYTVRVVSKVPWKGGVAYRAETVFGAVSVPFQLISSEEGVWRRNRPAVSDSPWSMEHVLALPENEGVVKSGITFRYKATEPVSVPSGAFADALHVQRVSDGKTCDLWYARGVGLVKRTCQETGVEETLVSYKLAPPPTPPSENEQSPSGTNPPEQPATPPDAQEQPGAAPNANEGVV